ncbi:hypothetical protein C8R46DRAFT_1139464 [Mycena filopes]|nr:hypothetical protein C8R46DRAFT_1139464 [Mycena filopes]
MAKSRRRAKTLDKEVPLGVAPVLDTRYQALLQSNEPPLEAERPFIESIVSGLRGRLARHDEKMSRSGLRTQLQRRAHEREALATDLARNAVILSPLRRMPPEILSEIFSWTLPLVWDVTGRGSIDTTKSPWILGCICSRWRTVAITSPALWSSVSVDCNVWQAPDASRAVSLLQLQLRRARNSHLRVSFETPPRYSPHQATLLGLLVERSPVWVEVHLILTPPLLRTLTALRDRIPLLHMLWLQAIANADSGDALVEDTIDSFLTAPVLRTVCLLVEQVAPSFLLPAHQLTRYQLHASWQKHVEILKMATNLLEAHIHVQDSLHAAPREVVELENLSRLSISHADVLDFLRLPALRELDIIFDFAPPHSPNELEMADFIDRMVARSSCVLRKLVVYGPIADLVIHILQRNQGILELVVALTDDASAEEVRNLVSFLAARDTEGAFSLAPQLEAVSVGITDEGLIDFEAFYDMISARSSRAFKSVSILISVGAVGPIPSTSIRGRLDDLRGKGLDVLFVVGGEADHMLCQWVLSVPPY